MISIITCSLDEAKFSALAEGLQRVFSEKSCELIRIPDARSLAEGYNRAIPKARGETLIFCHDDIEFLEPTTFARNLDRAFVSLDVVGIVGASRLIDGPWNGAGYPFIHGQIAHKLDHPVCPYSLDVYDTRARQIDGIKVLDGVFFAVKRPVVEKITFDADTFDGFHLYDIDFTFRAYHAGFRLGVRCDLALLHFSQGNYDDVWEQYRVRFVKKFSGKLDQSPVRGHVFAKTGVASKPDLVSLFTPPHWSAE